MDSRKYSDLGRVCAVLDTLAPSADECDRAIAKMQAENEKRARRLRGEWPAVVFGGAK
jgi:hypothetical protein